QGLPAPLLHPILGAVGVDRAGRHGELELRPQGKPRHHCPTLCLQLRDGPRARDASFRGPRTRAAGFDHRDRAGGGERAQPARLLPPLAAVHGGLELGGAGRPMSLEGPDLARLLLKQEIEEFLYREAELLDERRYEEWVDLLTEDADYFMPMRRNVPRDELEREFTRAGTDVNWFDEGKDTLTRRVKQILTGLHWAEEPPSRICHMVSNVQLAHAGSAEPVAMEVGVKSRFLIYRNRVETETDFLVGKREDLLRRVDGGWRIARRKIILDHSVLLAKALTVFFEPGGPLPLRVPRVHLGDLLVALVEGPGRLPVLDEHALDHLRDDVGVQHFAGGGGGRARVAHGHARLRHPDEVRKGRLLLPEPAVEEPLVHGHPAAARRLDDLVVVGRLHEVVDEALGDLGIGVLLERAVRPGVDLVHRALGAGGDGVKARHLL